jgi:NTP pyrophosphatase (non-canonical NTP hydrolase)
MTTITFHGYEVAAAATAMYPKDTSYPFLGLCGEAGEVAELAKKTIRDNNGIWTEDRRQLLKKELGDVLWYLAAIARDNGFTLDEIAQSNIDKLLSRKERGVLQGSGDNR